MMVAPLYANVDGACAENSSLGAKSHLPPSATICDRTKS